MAIEKVREYFRMYGREGDILEFDHSSATVALAAEALGCEEARIAKSMTFDAGGKTLMIVTAGDVKIDNAKYKHRFGVKARMLTPEEVDVKIGHSVGGVCPFALNDGVEVWLDESLKRFESVYPACGSSNSAIKLTPAELEKYSRCEGWVDVCKPKEEKTL